MSSQNICKNFSDGETANLIVQRDQLLPEIIIKLSSEEDPFKLSADIKLLLNFLKTYDDINLLNENILEKLIPSIKTDLQKIYDENIVISDTSDDEIIDTVLKENLKLAFSFMESSKIVVEYVSQFEIIPIKNIRIIPQNICELLYITFGHCKNCQNIYQDKVNDELLKLFRLCQEIHILVLKLFETNLKVTGSEDEIIVLNKVLQTLCNISEILFEISTKSMVDNWKGFLAIIQKFVDSLKSSINLQYPVRCITSEINKNLNKLFHENEVKKDTVGIIKVTGFLVKVVLKMLDCFWNVMNSIETDILNFCMAVAGFSFNFFNSFGSEIINIIETSFVKCIQPLFLRLLVENDFITTLSNYNSNYSAYYSILNIVNHVLKVIFENNEQFNGDLIVNILELIFNVLKKSYKDLVSSFSTFGDLVIHTAGLILIYTETHSDIERILLKNLLQTNFWCAVFSMEVYYILLRNSTLHTCTNTLDNLINQLEYLNFGLYTYRPEKIFLKIFIDRTFHTLPLHQRIGFINSRKGNASGFLLGLLAFEEISANHIPAIDSLIQNTIEKIEFNGSVEMNEFLLNMHNLSLIDNRNVNLNKEKIEYLWNFTINDNIVKNNIFYLFICYLLQITGIYVTDLSESQIFMILNQLTRLSVHKNYKLHLCHFLNSMNLLSKQFFEQYKFNSILSNICKNLCDKETDDLIKQIVLELIDSFANNSNCEPMIKMLLSNTQNVQLINFLKKRTDMVIEACDKDKYLHILENSLYVHICVDWNRYDVQNNYFKRLKVKKIQNNEANVPQITKAVSSDGQNDDIGEILDRIKQEIKCLTKALKTDALNRKNIADVNLIVNQLQSYL